jgi:DNA primase
VSAPQRQSGIKDFYEETVLPALAAHLDTAFPEFGWRRDSRGWVATNQEMTHRVLGVRADRVIAHGDAPAGFLIHGAEPTLWTAYANGGAVPRGREFADVVQELARRAGVERDFPQQRGSVDRRQRVLQAYFDMCQAELFEQRSAPARRYLEFRGLPIVEGGQLGLGVAPPKSEALGSLQADGFANEEIAAAALFADGRWLGRVVGAWRSQGGQVGTMWARTPDHFAQPDSKYLYLKGAPRVGLPPYGFGDLRLEPGDLRSEIVLVEGLLDVHQLRTQGMRNVAAIGGTSAPPSTFEGLARNGVESVVLAFDNDDAGRTATAKAVDAACRAQAAPAIRVVEPNALRDAKDPDAFVCERGIDAFRAIVADAECGVGWRANELIVTTGAHDISRRAALARAGQWLGTLPPRLALEQEEAIHAVAQRCGYSPEATARAFRARFWPDPSHQLTPRAHELDISPGGR